MVYILRLFSSKCSLFHNYKIFGSCIIHILYVGCAKIKNIIPATKVKETSFLRGSERKLAIQYIFPAEPIFLHLIVVITFVQQHKLWKPHHTTSCSLRLDPSVHSYLPESELTSSKCEARSVCGLAASSVGRLVRFWQRSARCDSSRRNLFPVQHAAHCPCNSDVSNDSTDQAQ